MQSARNLFEVLETYLSNVILLSSSSNAFSISVYLTRRVVIWVNQEGADPKVELVGPE